MRSVGDAEGLAHKGGDPVLKYGPLEVAVLGTSWYASDFELGEVIEPELAWAVAQVAELRRHRFERIERAISWLLQPGDFHMYEMSV